jgi:uncharacterized protein YndB with AHSA1/START domain
MVAAMDDVFEALGLTRRIVSTIELNGRPARRTEVSRAYPTGIDDLWDALTNVDRIPRWFLPIKGDLQLGGHYQFEGQAGGAIEACEPPRRFRVTWEMGDAPTTWVTITLTTEAEKTRLHLDHVGPVPEEFWTQFGPGATGVGWDGALYGLGRHIATGATVDPAEAMAWMASPEGVEYLRQSNDAWKAASIASGTPVEAAEAAAARTFAAYTGQA